MHNGRRGSLLAFISLLAVSLILLTIVSRPIINHRIDRHVQNQIVQRLSQDKICRHVATGEPARALQDSITACRDLIYRIMQSSTVDQRHAIAIRLLSKGNWHLPRSQRTSWTSWPKGT